MLTLFLTIATMFIAVGTLIYTDSNKLRYTDYQIRMFLREQNILHQ